jgi:glucose/mannose transport system permease protein
VAFKGSDLLFGFMLFGVFMPLQVVLLPMSQVLGWLGLSTARLPGWCWCTAWRAWPAPRCSSATTTPPFRDELVNAARMDGAGFWRIFWRIVLPMSTPILMVTLIWQFTNIWNDFLFGVAFQRRRQQADHGGPEQHGQHHQQRQKYNVDMAAAIIAGCPPCWSTCWPAVFRQRSDCRCGQRLKGFIGHHSSWQHPSTSQASARLRQS